MLHKVLFKYVIFMVPFIVSCDKNAQTVNSPSTYKTEIEPTESTSFVSFQSHGDDFKYENYSLKYNSNGTFDLYDGNKLLCTIDFEGMPYDGPGFLAYINSQNNNIDNIIIEATADVGTGWYYSVIIKNHQRVNEFFIKEPLSNSDIYPFEDFANLAISNDSLHYTFNKKQIAKYATVPNDLKSDNNFVYLNVPIQARVKSETNEMQNLKSIKEQQGFSLIFEQSKDINSDNIPDVFYVFKTNKPFDSDDDSSKTSDIVIFLSNNNSYIKYSNPTFFPNNSNDQFETITFDKNSFTIKLFNEIPNEYFIEKYIQFLCKENEIHLQNITMNKEAGVENVEIPQSQKNIDFDHFDMNQVIFR